MAKSLKIIALITISTLAGDIKPGEVGELDLDIANKLIEEGKAKRYYEDDANTTKSSKTNKIGIEELKADELKKLAKTIGYEGNESKKDELIDALIEFISKDENLKELLDEDVESLRELINENE